ncbi:MAG: hypothetical protein Q7Q71_06880 [Verrucomicrobiota bacterium JB023]|nr:hypothetical protein [Verrucomicrobiota bacterium JB023]
MVAHPEKELRFTRIAQARFFVMVAALAATAAIILFGIAHFPERSPISYWPSLPPLIISILSLPCAWRCARKAFLILSPVGIEIFPFFRPVKNFRLIPWQDFHYAEVIVDELHIHFDEAQTAGVVISLSPLDKARQDLLARAIEGRMQERGIDMPKESLDEPS